MNISQEVNTEIKKIIFNNADAIQKLATQHHKEFLADKRFRSEFIEKYQQVHIKVVEEFANNLDAEDIKKATVIFKKIGRAMAHSAVKDNLRIDEAVDGIVFLKQAVWEIIKTQKIYKKITVEEFYIISQRIGTYCDVMTSKIAFTFHDYYTALAADSTMKLQQAEKSAKEGWERLQRIFMEAPIPIAILKGPDQIFELSNPQNNIAIGVSNPIGRSVKKLFKHSKETLKIIDTVYRTGKPHYLTEYPLDIKTPEGMKSFYINATYQPIFDTQGKVEGMMTTGIDVTQEVLARKKIHESEQNFRSLIDAIPHMIWVIDPDGKTSYINKQWAEWTDMTVEKINAGKWSHILHPDDYKKVMRDWNNAFHNGTSFTSEYRVRNRKGDYVWFMGKEVPVKDRNGNVIRWIGTATNIQEQKVLQGQKDEFIAVATHELKTPVTTLKGYTQVLQKRFIKVGDEVTSRHLGKMDSQLNRLTSLIGDLLDASKIDAGKLQLHLDYFGCTDLIMETIESMQQTTERHNLLLKGTCNKNIYGDRTRIGQVISNFLSNAIKYSPHGDKIIINVKDDENTVTLCVQDFGVGISEKTQPHVFDRFYRETGTIESTFPGLGLGLYISKEIIERHGGTIWVDSIKGKGSTFCFRIPIHKTNKIIQQVNSSVEGELIHD